MANRQRYVIKNGIDNGKNTIINVSDPTNLSDVATKNYVDTKGSLTVTKINTSGGAYTVNVTDGSLGPYTVLNCYGSTTVSLPIASSASNSLNNAILTIVNTSSTIGDTVTISSSNIRDRSTSIVLERQSSVVLLCSISDNIWIVLQENLPLPIVRSDAIALNAMMRVNSDATIALKRGQLNVTSQKISTGVYRITADAYSGDSISAMCTLVNPTFVGFIYTGNYTANTFDVYIKDTTGAAKDCAFNTLISYKTVN